MNELAAFDSTIPALPAEWDYDDSVLLTRRLKLHWKNATEELLTELWIAHEKLAEHGGDRRSINVANATNKTWADYCGELDIDRKTIWRWFVRVGWGKRTEKIVSNQSVSLHGGNVDIIYNASCLDGMTEVEAGSINCCVTSPPYWGQRDYKVAEQIGAEETVGEYIDKLVQIGRHIRRVLAKDGVFWLNLGDKYDSGDLMLLPHMVALALKQDGWHLRSEVIWHKPAPMPQGNVKRCTQAHEQLFMFTKNKAYWYDAAAVATPTKNGDGKARRFRDADPTATLRGDDGRGYEPRTTANLRDVWTVGMEPSKVGHLAVFPSKLIEPCVLSCCPPGGAVLDPFMGSGTSAVVAKENGRHYVGYEVNPDFVTAAHERIREVVRGLGIV